MIGAGTEFHFELAVCRWAECRWEPAAADSVVLVARQLGTRRRRFDTVIVEADPDAVRRRAAFGDRAIESDLRAILRGAPAEWTWYRDALPEPDYPWRYVREAIHEADRYGVLDVRRSGNRIEIRRRYEFPDWVRRLVAVENKPDFDAKAAAALREQIEHDVALGLVDEVWIATADADRAIVADAPVEAGVLVVTESDDWPGVAATTAWHPRRLAVDEPGVRIEDRSGDGGRVRFSYADADWKARKRYDIAERAYARGFRSYADAMRPDCRSFELRAEGGVCHPYCTAKGRGQTSRECAGSCPEFEPEPPTWRTGEWPVDGGPGRGYRRLLDRRRERRRPRPSDEG